MAANRNVLHHIAGQQIDAADGSCHGDAARVDAYGFGPRVAALTHLTLRRRRFWATENAYVSSLAVGGDDGRDRFDAERDRTHDGAAVCVDDRESVVGREGQDREPFPAVASTGGNRGRASHVVAD